MDMAAKLTWSKYQDLTDCNLLRIAQVSLSMFKMQHFMPSSVVSVLGGMSNELTLTCLSRVGHVEVRE